VSSSAIYVKANGWAADNPDSPITFSNITEGQSGISYWASTSPAVSETVFVSSISWVQTTNYVLISGQLLPDTTYYFRAQSRNALSSTTTVSAVYSTSTLANLPGTPNQVAITSTSITISINPNNNPANTKYSIYCITTDKYVQADGNLGSAELFNTYSGWGGSSGTEVKGLSSSTEYKFKVRAKNNNDIYTLW